MTITGTSFVSGASASFSRAGITVNSTTFVSATQLTANITISGSATTGAGNVTITNPDAGVGTGTNVFTALLYGFEDGTEGWQAGSQVSSVASVSSFANGPGTAYGGAYALDAKCAPVLASTWHTIYVTPATPINLSAAKTLYLYEDGYGGAPGATGYETMVTLTGSDGTTLSTTAQTSADAWNEVELDVSAWPERSQVTKIAVSFHAVGSAYPNWSCHFQIDNVGWTG